MENLSEKKLIRAKLRVAEIKKFYKHLVTYILVNLFLAFVWNFSFKIFRDFIVSNQFDGDGFSHIPIWLVWGIFLIIHALKTFDYLNFFGKDWEQRKRDEFMKE
jgi:TRAP-type C4-dicarboxylate transport system permease small subunit|tara:strand:- start:204 stop:515 length:312 start_codon:yes stop_codon:yes gene_type:complete